MGRTARPGASSLWTRSGYPSGYLELSEGFCRLRQPNRSLRRSAAAPVASSEVNREDAGVESSLLTDDEAMEVFENGCDEVRALGFRLHVMYARAAAFKPLQEIAEGETGSG